MSNGGDNDLGGFSMLDLFRIEAETHAAALNDGLLALEESPTPAQLEALMRAAHSIKGAARIVDLDPVVALAHALEDCFVAAQEGKIVLGGDAVDILLRGVDMLSRFAAVPQENPEAWLNERKAECDSLVEVVRGIHTGQPPAVLSSPAHEEDAHRIEDEGVTQPAPAASPVRGQGMVVQADTAETRPERMVREAAPAEDTNATGRVVRITAENLNRLMGLAGEQLVQTRWLRPFGKTLLDLKGSQNRLSRTVDAFREALGQGASTQHLRDLVTDLQQQVGDCRKELTERMSDLDSFARRADNLANRLYREVIASRMRPFADGVRGFPRLVRDLARKLGKNVRFEILGEATEVDRDILEKLEAPLNHLLRNAVDHGMESPEVRAAAGKSEQGTLRLEARHKAGLLSITVSEDGKGIDLESLRGTIVERNLASADMVAGMNDSELLDFLFLPGFSTAKQLTEVSGRGVGLDVVHDMVQEVGGLVRASTNLGAGTSFELQLPITLSVLRALLVRISGEPYAFPLARIDRTLMVRLDELNLIENRHYLELEGDSVGLLPAYRVLELEVPEHTTDRVHVVVLSDRRNRYGLQVDRFLGEHELVVRPIDPRIGKIRDISSAAVMEDGTPVLIIDVDDMVRSIDMLLSGGRIGRLERSRPPASGKAAKRVLVVDDSITVREVERKLLENRGYGVDVAIDGMDGWNALRGAHYDLVISDVDMPRMNGIELVKLIRGDEKLAGLPVVIVSYKDREEDRLLGLDAGANQYLTKSSFHDETLVQAVADLIGEP